MRPDRIVMAPPAFDDAMMVRSRALPLLDRIAADGADAVQNVIIDVNLEYSGGRAGRPARSLRIGSRTCLPCRGAKNGRTGACRATRELISSRASTASS